MIQLNVVFICHVAVAALDPPIILAVMTGMEGVVGSIHAQEWLESTLVPPLSTSKVRFGLPLTVICLMPLFGFVAPLAEANPSPAIPADVTETSYDPDALEPALT